MVISRAIINGLLIVIFVKLVKFTEFMTTKAEKNIKTIIQYPTH
jgi:hypothetical protein